MRKPVIGVISVSRPFDTAYFGEVNKSYVIEEYTEVLKDLGAVPIALTQVDSCDIDAQLDLVDGLLIVGGADVDPTYYGEERHEKLGYTNVLDDIYHMDIIRSVEKRDLPFMGICRGSQIFNVTMGGSLYQDLPSQLSIGHHHEQKEERTIPTHYVNTVDGSKLQGLIGKKAFVNSFHHQAIKEAGNKLMVAAYSEDDIIEAVEHQTARFMLGVQWHPEQLVKNGEQMLPLFGSLIEHSKDIVIEKIKK